LILQTNDPRPAFQTPIVNAFDVQKVLIGADGSGEINAIYAHTDAWVVFDAKSLAPIPRIEAAKTAERCSLCP
jgi:hypothetical protein